MEETFDKIIETLGAREQLESKRAELTAKISEMTLDEQVDHYCPTSVSPYEWPVPWPRTPLHKDFWREREKRRRQWAEKRDKAAISDTTKRLRSPNHCTCGCKEITGDHIECWISGNYVQGHPDHNRVVPCRCKIVAERGRLRDWLMQVSGLASMGPMVPSFGHWNDERFPEAAALKQHFMDWSQDRADKAWLFVYGPPGTGKTHLSQSAILAVVGRQKRGFYMDVLEFISQGRYKMGQDGGNEFSEWVQSIKKAPYLAIDDIGQEYATDWTASVLREILHWRYMHSMPTVICSNRNPSELVKSLGEATVDRLRDSQLCTSLHITQGRSQRPLLGEGD